MVVTTDLILWGHGLHWLHSFHCINAVTDIKGNGFTRNFFKEETRIRKPGICANDEAIWLSSHCDFCSFRRLVEYVLSIRTDSSNKLAAKAMIIRQICDQYLKQLKTNKFVSGDGIRLCYPDLSGRDRYTRNKWCKTFLCLLATFICND